MKHTKHWTLFSALLLSVAVLIGCISLPPERFDTPIPDREIVFVSDGKTGFIHSDGSGLVEFEGALLQPRWGGKKADYLLWTGPWKRIFFAKDRDYIKECSRFWVWEMRSVPGTDDIVALVRGGEDSERLVRINFKRCRLVKDYLEETRDLDLGTNPAFENFIVFSRTERKMNRPVKTEIVLLDTSTSELRILKTLDITNNDIQSPYRAPAFSPNGRWIAYTDVNSIRLMRPDGTEDHELVNVKGWYENGLFSWPPAASFSPDEQWMVFHRCPKGNCSVIWDVGPGRIYKVNVQTQEETLLFDNGGNPIWRLKGSED